MLARYGGEAYVRQGLYYPYTHSYEPYVIFQEIMRWFDDERAKGAQIDVYFNREIRSVETNGDKLVGIDVWNYETNQPEQFLGDQVIDASEHGDVIRLSPGFSRSGKDVMPGVQSDTYIQSITYVPVVMQYPKGQVPKELQFSVPPPGYTPELDAELSKWFSDDGSWDRGGSPSSWPKSPAGTKGYRGLPRVTNPDMFTSVNAGVAAFIQKAAINFTLNDTPVLAKYNTDLAYRREMDCTAKIRAMWLLYKFQLLGWGLAVDPEEGFAQSAYNQRNTCDQIPPALKNIELRMPLEPYVREANRLVGEVTVESPTIRYMKLENFHNPDGPWVGFDDPNKVAVCGYPMDVHGGKAVSDFDLNIDDPYDAVQANEMHSRFQVTLKAFYPLQDPSNRIRDGLIAAEKNLSMSRAAVAAVRLHPCAMLTGQASGALAAIAAKKGIPASQVLPAEVRQAIGYREVGKP